MRDTFTLTVEPNGEGSVNLSRVPTGKIKVNGTAGTYPFSLTFTTVGQLLRLSDVVAGAPSYTISYTGEQEVSVSGYYVPDEDPSLELTSVDYTAGIEYKVTDTELTDVADAIRTKGGTSAPLTWPSGYVSAVQNIPTGGGGDNYKIAIGTMTGSIYDAETVSLPEYAFGYRDSIHGEPLTGVEMPNCTQIGSRAFYECTALSVAKFPLCSYIGNSAFYACRGLENISLPVCEVMGQSAFYDCIYLSSIILPECKSVFTQAFAHCLSLQYASFPKCDFIGSVAFSSCALLSQIYAPEALSIGSSCFQSCSSLAQADFPKCAYVGSNAFSACQNMSVALFPVCSYFGSSAFMQCSRLDSIYILSTSVVSFTTNLFRSTPMLVSSYLGHYGSVYVPASLVETYKAAAGWSSISDRITAYAG